MGPLKYEGGPSGFSNALQRKLVALNGVLERAELRSIILDHSDGVPGDAELPRHGPSLKDLFPAGADKVPGHSVSAGWFAIHLYDRPFPCE